MQSLKRKKQKKIIIPFAVVEQGKYSNIKKTNFTIDKVTATRMQDLRNPFENIEETLASKKKHKTKHGMSEKEEAFTNHRVKRAKIFNQLQTHNPDSKSKQRHEFGGLIPQ